MTSSMQERIIAQISRPPAKRNTHQLDVLLPWLRKKSDLLRKLDRNVLLEIVRNCDYLRGETDDVIITQGDDGDRLYIILSGTVSVYIDGKISGEQGMSENDALKNVEQRVENDAPTEMDTKSHSIDLGNRNPTSEDLQDTVSEAHESEVDSSSVAVQGKATKRTKYGRFVVKFESGQCFGEVALINRDSKRNATIIADETCSFLVIKRYLYNTTLKTYQEQEYVERRAFVNSHPLFRGWHPKFLKLLEMSLIKETYSYDCNIVKQGDEWRGLYFIIKGNTKMMVEPARHESQYPEWAPFKSFNDVFEIELGRSSKQHLKPLGNTGADRNRTKAAEHIFIKRHEGYAAAEERRKNRSIFLCNVGEGEMFGDIEISVTPPLSTYHHSIVCTSDTEVYCLNNKNFERFITKKYSHALKTLKLQVETKLKNRSQSQQGLHVPFLRHLVFKMSEEIKPVPRDLPALRTSKGLPEKTVLFEHLIEAFKANRAELCLPSVPGAIYIRETMRQKARARYEEKKLHMEEFKAKRKRKGRMKFPSKARTTKELKAALNKQRIEEEENERKILLQEIRLREEEEMRKMELNTVNLKNFVVQFQDPVLLAQDGLNVNNSNQVETTEREPTFITELPSRPHTTKIEVDVMSVPEPRSYPKELKNVPKKASSMQDFTHEDGIYEDTEDAESLNESIMEEKEPRNESKMRFVSEFLRRGHEVPENPAYRDWETSDKSMRYLEERIKRFMVKNSTEGPVISKLSRFQVKDEDEVIPKPGGKVMCKPRACVESKFKDKPGHVTKHEHFPYKMVPHIPDYTKHRKTKMLVQMSLDDKREKWLLENSTT